ncbi:MAG: hypothetical protein FWB74_00300 [Defluviitaleaceae bacterium]|nr:hypothetical protein [Defluviitaleaceae bacterium]
MLKKASLSLDVYRSALVFKAEDFGLRFLVSDKLTAIKKVLEQEKDGYLTLFFNDDREESIYLPDALKYIRLDKDFSDYEIEVVLNG